MLRLAMRRLSLLVPTLLGVATIVFAFMRLLPGDPIEIMLGETAAAADITALRRDLGLDRPVLLQYARFVTRTMQGDLGESLSYHVPVREVIIERMPATIELGIVALLLALAGSLPLGVAAALRPHSVTARVAHAASAASACLPTLVLGPLLMLVFGITLGWLPVSGRGDASHVVLPAMTLGFGLAGVLTRMTLTSVRSALGAEYVRTARAKGASERRVVWHHVLRNALLPITTVIGLQLGALLAGTLITETIFAWPGLGRLAVQAIDARDYPLIQGCVLVFGCTYVLVNTATDLLQRLIDPRLGDAD